MFPNPQKQKPKRAFAQQFSARTNALFLSAGKRTFWFHALGSVIYFLRLLPVTTAAISATAAGIKSAGSASPVFGEEEVLLEFELVFFFVVVVLVATRTVVVFEFAGVSAVALVVFVVPVVVAAVVGVCSPLSSVVFAVVVVIAVVVASVSVVVAEVVGVCSPLSSVVFAVVVVVSVVVVVVVLVGVVKVPVPIYISTITTAFSLPCAISKRTGVPSSFRTRLPSSSISYVRMLIVLSASNWK